MLPARIEPLLFIAAGPYCAYRYFLQTPPQTTIPPGDPQYMAGGSTSLVTGPGEPRPSRLDTPQPAGLS